MNLTRKSRCLEVRSIVCFLLAQFWFLFSVAAAGKTEICVKGSFTLSNSNRTNTFNTVVFLTDHAWHIVSTNRATGDWSEIGFDGDSILSLVSGDASSSQSSDRFGAFGYAYSGEFLSPHAPDSARIFFPWMLHCLDRKFFLHNEKISLALPWTAARFSPGAYGYRWDIGYLDNANEIQTIRFVRDRGLDFADDEAELRRAGLDYPFSLPVRTIMLDALATRRATPDGFLCGVYEVEQWADSPLKRIPSKASLTVYVPNHPNLPTIRLGTYEWALNTIETNSDAKPRVLSAPVRTFVVDYRFQATNAVTKFNHAKYVLNAGDYFKPANDAALLAEAANWLENGPRYGLGKKRAVVVGVILGVLLFPFGIWLWREKQKRKGKVCRE